MRFSKTNYNLLPKFKHIVETLKIIQKYKLATHFKIIFSSDIYFPVQGYSFRSKLPRPIGGKSSRSSRRKRGWRPYDAGAATPLRRLVDRKLWIRSALCSSSPCALSDSISIHESNLRLSFESSRAARTETLTAALCSATKSSPVSSVTKKGGVRFRTASLVTCTGNHRDQSRDVNCTRSSLLRIFR